MSECPSVIYRRVAPPSMSGAFDAAEADSVQDGFKQLHARLEELEEWRESVGDAAVDRAVDALKSPAPPEALPGCPVCGATAIKRYDDKGYPFVACSRYPHVRLQATREAQAEQGWRALCRGWRASDA